MRVLFVMDPLERLNLAGDSTFMLMRECTARGYAVAWCTPDQLFATPEGAAAAVEWVRTVAEAPHFHRGAREDQPLGAFDMVWMRKDPPFDMHYVFSTYLLEMVPPTTRVFNRPDSIRSRNEKLFALRFPALTPPTLLTRDAARIRAFAEAHGRVVLKPWDGNGGRGVMVSSGEDPNLPAMIEVLSEEGRRAVLVQRYLPAIREGDKRIILIDGEPAGAMLRVPGPRDHRGNLHVGATVQATSLTDRERAICAALGPTLREEGLLFVGIDVIGGFLTEINVTSPTGIQEINRLDGVQLERQVMDAAIRRISAPAPAAGG